MKPLYSFTSLADGDSIRQFIGPILQSKALIDVMDLMSKGVMKPVHSLAVLRLDDFRDLTIYSPSCFENKTLIAKTDSDFYLVTEHGKILKVHQTDQIEKMKIIINESAELLRLSFSSSLRMEC